MFAFATEWIKERTHFIWDKKETQRAFCSRKMIFQLKCQVVGAGVKWARASSEFQVCFDEHPGQLPYSGSVEWVQCEKSIAFHPLLDGLLCNKSHHHVAQAPLASSSGRDDGYTKAKHTIIRVIIPLSILHIVIALSSNWSMLVSVLLLPTRESSARPRRYTELSKQCCRETCKYGNFLWVLECTRSCD